MGFNISGLVINKNYQDNFDELQKELGWTLEKEEDITFEGASTNWKGDDICDVYFSEEGTMLFLGIEKTVEPYRLKQANTLTYVLSEMTMTFNLNYCEKGVLEREILEMEGERIMEDGEKLEVEENSEDASEVIWDQMEVVLGKSFWEVDPNEPAVRYRFVPNSVEKEVHEPTPIMEEELVYTETAAQPKDKWWKFW